MVQGGLIKKGPRSQEDQARFQASLGLKDEGPHLYGKSEAQQ
jgi:hypothetical protein